MFDDEYNPGWNTSGGDYSDAITSASSPTANPDFPLLSTRMDLDYGTSYNSYGTASSEAEVGVRGNSNDPPLVSTKLQTDSTGQSPFKVLTDLLGTVRTVARDIGSTVGTVRNTTSQVTQDYKTAEQNAATGNKLGQWWQYSSTQDKLMVALGALGIYVVLIKK